MTVVNGKFTWAKQDPPVLHKYVMKSHILCVCTYHVLSNGFFLKHVNADSVLVVLT